MFITAMRRKYIPPLMECFQDILVISYYYFNESKNSEEIQKESQLYLKEVHQKVVDTFHPITRICPDIYFVLVKQKADALLMDENSMAYFSQQLNIRPHITSSLAIAYVKSILKILKKNNTFVGIKPLINLLSNMQKIENEQNKQLQINKVLGQQQEELKAEQIVEKINNWRSESQSQGGNELSKKDNKKNNKINAKEQMWQAKVARYLAYCVDGGLLQSKFTISTMIQYAEKVTDSDDI